MNCFKHREKPALGVCKSCGKGLCEECLQEVPNGLSCKGECEGRVAIIGKMVDDYPRTLGAARNLLRRNAVLYMTLGSISLLIFFLLCVSNGLDVALFPGILGLIFSTLGIVALRRKNQYPE